MMSSHPALIEVARSERPVEPLAAFVLIAYWPGGSSHWVLGRDLWQTEEGAHRARRDLERRGYQHVTIYRVEHDGK